MFCLNRIFSSSEKGKKQLKNPPKVKKRPLTDSEEGEEIVNKRSFLIIRASRPWEGGNISVVFNS